MEKRIRKYSLIILTCLLLLPVLLRADDLLQKAQKTVVKKIAVAKNMQLNISNQYGGIVIQRWKRTSAMIQVTITGRSVKLSRANTLIRFVTIKTSKIPGAVSLETVIDTLAQHINPSSGEQCLISYTVFVPAGLKLAVTNRFGNIQVKSFEGELAIDEKFGDLKIERASGPIRIDAEQGSADIDRIHGGSLRFKGFTQVRIGELSGAVDARFWSGGSVDLGLSNDLQKLSINADNVKPLNITNLKLANADLKIHSTVSKIIYNGRIMLTLEKTLNVTLKKPLKIDTVFVMGKSDTTKKIAEKLLNLKKISITAMKSVDYTLKTGSATTGIKIDVSFCVVNVKD
ncbi:hypothetical protein KXD93_24660 [Mucilaginibacter sp. BJC16-A38]|uniref:hypothetical protein n=1 Tax=Mucilaginibacter phenanthrenivorans TaxID=1234842 RepID=UPI002157A518|nr:hypothetical protein [Mucilaginibacter phenanthrenivorans]MCR8560872.1 hypothetical protein [Mucilaginibacter phenanthrenivorans]